MDNQEKLRQILNSPDWTQSEKAVVKWQFGLTDDFLSTLWKAIVRADDENLAKLEYGFPIEVYGFLQWNRSDLAKRLRDSGLMI